MSLPPALSLKNFAKEGTMKIQTTVLEPQIKENNFVRYVLEKRAILDSNSIFTFRVSTTIAGHLPVYTGIGSVIKSCTLRLGNVVVSRTQEWPYYDAIRSGFKSTEERTQRDSVIKGTMSTWRPSLKTDGTLVLRNAVYPVSRATGLSNPAQSATPPQLDTVLVANDTSAQGVTLSLKLSELFPALAGMQIPLGHMEDNMVVEFELNTQVNGENGRVVCANSGLADATNTPVTYHYDDFKMLADYLSFSDATHEEIDDRINGGKGMFMPFHEIDMVRGQLLGLATEPTATTDVPTTQELGMVGRTLKYILIADVSNEAVSDSTGNPKNGRPSGVYELHSPIIASETNVKINDQQVYPHPIDSTSHYITELGKIFGRPYAVTRAEYDMGLVKTPDTTAVNQLLDSAASLDGDAYSDLTGTRHVTGIPLVSNPMTGAGTKIIDKPIRVERIRKCCKNDYDAKTSLYFCAIEKAFMIKDGQVSVMA